MKTSITIDIDTEKLPGYTDDYLALLWSVAQANPAPHGDRDASELVDVLAAEIVRRFLVAAPPTLYTHQAVDRYRKPLSEHGHWIDQGNKWVPGKAAA